MKNAFEIWISWPWFAKLALHELIGCFCIFFFMLNEELKKAGL